MRFEEILKEEQTKEYFINLQSYLQIEYQTKEIYPIKEDIFRCFKETPLENVKVVFIGQDPYATKGYACGLSFAVQEGVKVPKSLQNIYKEIYNELGLEIPHTGNLISWAHHGILLLNMILTVERDKPLSHKNKGWEKFTKRVIEELNAMPQKIVFILLGNEAKALTNLLSNPNHLVLKSSHPSPLGAYHGFFGSNIFKETIDYLGEDKTFWEVTDEK